MKYYSLLLFLFFNSLFARDIEIQKASVADKLSRLEKHELVVLEDFFRHLFEEGDFAYTLFGNKPIASCDHNLKLAKNYRYFWKKACIDFKGSQIWKKYEDLFPISDYLFILPECIDEDYTFSIHLIHISKCRDVIKEHPSLFQNILGGEENDSLEKVKALLTHPKEFREEFQEYHACLGLLYGYDEKHSLKFQLREHYSEALSSLPLDITQLNSQDQQQMTKKKRCRFSSFTSPKDLVKKLNDLSNQRRYSVINDSMNSLRPYRTPGYMTFNKNSDLKPIPTKIDHLSKKLTHIYYSENFLEIIIKKLTGED